MCSNWVQWGYGEATAKRKTKIYLKGGVAISKVAVEIFDFLIRLPVLSSGLLVWPSITYDTFLENAQTRRDDA